jgi:hypothetical protein
LPRKSASRVSDFRAIRENAPAATSAMRHKSMFFPKKPVFTVGAYAQDAFADNNKDKIDKHNVITSLSTP